MHIPGKLIFNMGDSLNLCSKLFLDILLIKYFLQNNLIHFINGTQKNTINKSLHTFNKC